MDIKVPSVGESVFEAVVARWLKQNGERVAKDEPLCEVETDKVTIEINADADGILTISAQEGQTVKIGAVIGTIEEKGAEAKPEAPAAEAKPEAQAEPAEQAKPEAGRAGAAEAPTAAPQPEAEAAGAPPTQAAPPMSPSGRKLAREMGVETRDLKGSGRGGRVTNEDLLKGQQGEGAVTPAQPIAEPAPAPAAPRAPEPPRPSAPTGAAAPVPRVAQQAGGDARGTTRKAMTPIRKRIAERLVSARQHTAMLTTFNEADMTEVLRLRQKYGEHFMKRHNVKLGLMSLFIRACCQALQEFPEVNASIEGEEIVYHNYCDIGVAIGGEKGLVVPVLRNAELLTLAQIEQGIADFAEKIRTNRLAIADLEGGTFTVSNGGVYGSLLSTPILNPPQSGVLGMHAIQDRAVVRDNEIVIRPMMYLALSYDHRIVDGKGAVGFLKRVKECVEQPEEMLLES